MANEPTVGLVGLGVLGSQIAAELAVEHFSPTVFDVRPEAIARAVASGASGAASAAEVAAVSDVVLVCVQNDEQCIEVVTGAAGILDGASPGAVIGILSTVHPDTITDLAAVAARRSVRLVDAPLAGKGVDGVRERSMWAMVGGDDASFAVVEPILEAFTGRVVHSGVLGSGAALKLAHNVMIYLGYLAAYEASELARVAGVQDGLLVELTRSTGALSAQADVMLTIHERRRSEDASSTTTNTAHEDHVMRMASEVLEKDLRIAIELAQAYDLELPGAVVTQPLGDVLYQVRP